MKLSTKRDVTSDTTSDTTSEEFSDIENTSSDDDDLLFGDFGEDQTLNNPSSIKKHRTIESSLTRSNRITRLNSQNLSSINKKNDIFGPTKSSTNHLEKQLGFSLSRKTQESSVTKSQMFKKLLTEVKKEKEIGILIAGEKTEEENKIEIENKINHWIETRVDPKFLKAEVNGIDLNKKWISDLKKTLRKVIQAYDMSFNEKLIDTEILKFPEYCNFRCFKSADNALGKPQKFGEFMFLEPSIKTLIHSTNIRYVENFELEWKGTENISCSDIYEALYLNSEIMNSKESVNISFDNKSILPSLGCGFELLRFVQIINTTKYDIFSKEIVIRSLILLCSDFNVRSEINHYKYQGEYLTGRDIGVLKLKEFAEDPELLTILSQTLQLVPELWFEIIRQFTNTNYKKDIIFKGKLIVDFLAKNTSCISFEWINTDDMSEYDILNLIAQYLDKLSHCHLKSEDEHILRTIKLDIELVKDWLLINSSLLKDWETHSAKKEVIKSITKSIQTIKSHFFINFSKSMNIIVPQCKKILDFMYHEIAASDIGDLFAE